jgi:Fe-S-cluster-containing dehydrogenase component
MQRRGRKVFHAIRELCTGCLMCEQMCSVRKTGRLNPYLARIRVSRNRGDHAWVPIICHHCRVPLCQEACPVPEAMTRDEALGVVVVNDAACIGCLACVEACPFGAIQVGPHNEILKCDLCQGDPACVRYCPPRPENSLPHLPWPRQSCLQYVAPHQVARHKHLSTLARGKRGQLPRAELEKRHGLAPQLMRQAPKYTKA